ncbi:MAG TPA: endo-1,3-alpha-glucanase family glycosylhydrolase [Candidatus Angelobacter sp.]|nr:endo-1,3-alpha-glucanase family glycosylhydrolase [Candidatus Angelobacter sp.]
MQRLRDFTGIALFLLALCGCARPSPRETLVKVPAPRGGPMLLAVYQPWFGNGQHLDVGYSCHDPAVLRRQIASAKGLNIGGFVVNWYGPRKEFEDKSLALLEQAAAENDFNVAVQYDEAVDHPGYATDAVLVDLQYLYDRYISPNSGAARSAYLRYQGRPVIFIFPKDASTDWNRVRRLTQSWPDPPLLIYKDQSAKYPNAFDGYYAWVQPGKAGWARDGSHDGEDYLEAFYKNMNEQHPDKLAVGAVWPGFDDTRASWSLNRHMAYRCGKTFEDTLRVFRHFYGNDHPSPYLLIVTWNDYEEGTDIERSIGHCANGADSAHTGGN